MTEKIIPVERVNPGRFFGPDNVNFQYIKSCFPKLKLAARGNEIKVSGSAAEVSDFEQKLSLMFVFLEHHPQLTTTDIQSIVGNQIPREGEVSGPAEAIVFGPKGNVVRARTANQRKLVEEVSKNDVVFAVGPAGTGKTYTAVALAVRALKNKEIKRLILARPAVEAGESLGFLPGDLKEKIDPYLKPLYDSLSDMIPADKYARYIENGTIEIIPLAFMRGRTLDHCFVILDEAQNATETQLKMFLTRMGPNAKVVITGDLSQIDLPRSQRSGLSTAIRILGEIKGIKIVELDTSDVVRHRLVKEIIKAYDTHHNSGRDLAVERKRRGEEPEKQD
ncbi:MAG: PhoH family protein [Flavobacteriales bacterium]|nr:PhoH family protein [Flavobacteriales bacterium]